MVMEQKMGTSTTTTTVEDVIDAKLLTPSEMETSKKTSLQPIQALNDDGSINTALISLEQKAKFDKLTSGLAVTDINSVTNYGADLQNALHSFSNEYLKSVRTSKTGELGGLMTNLLVTINGIDIDGIKDKPFVHWLRRVPVLKHLAPSIEKKLVKYDNVQNVIKEYERTIDATRLLAQRDNNSLSIMFDNNVKVIQHLEDIIIAGKLKLEELKKKLSEMEANRSQYQDYEIQDTQEFINNLDKRIGDLMAQYYSTKVSLPQIRAVQYNNIAVANNAATLISTTLPIWRSQLAFSVALNNQKDSIEVHKAVTDATNEMMRKNAELLHVNSVNVARETQRAVIDVETLKDVTAKLVETIKETKAIEAEGAAKRRAAEEELLKLGGELGRAMTEITDSHAQMYLPKE